MMTGTWGTNADREETISLGGSSSIKMYSSTATKIAWPMVPISSGIAQDRDYEVKVVWQASDITAGFTGKVELEIYNGSGVLQTTTTIRAAAVLTAADTWEVVSSRVSITNSAYRYARVVITKGASDFQLYIDEVEIRPVCPYISAYDNTLTTSAGAWTTAVLDVNSNASEMYLTGGFARTYHWRRAIITAHAWFSSAIADGSLYGIRIYYAGAALATQHILAGAGSGGQGVSLATAVTATMIPGSAYGVEVWTDAIETVEDIYFHATLID